MVSNRPVPPASLHTCDYCLCVNPFHLKLGTLADNIRDMVQKGRQAKGEKNGRSKLSGKQVLEIRTLYNSGKFSQNALAKVYSESRSNISSITRGKYWKLPLAN